METVTFVRHKGAYGMKYELDRLGPDNFEKLIQSLLMGIAGAQTIVYGDGPDGGRDAVIQNANHEIVKDVRAKGYTVAQMKFKSPDGKEDDWTWLQKNLKKELDSFQEKRKPGRSLCRKRTFSLPISF